MPYVLGLDIGSSATKVGLFSLEGDVIATAARCYPTLEPRPAYKEQDPELWWAAAVEGVSQVTAGIDPAGLLALGATGHISSFTFVDPAGRPLRPAIGFQDQRALAELNVLYRAFSRQELAAHLGIDLPPAATWPLPKLLWLATHEPATLLHARHLLQAKDFINLRLTGEFSSDASSNRGMVDFSCGRPADEVFRKLGLRTGLLPPLHPPDAIIGSVSAQAASQTGLRAGLPVVTGWNDLNACALGSGAVNPGAAFNITGTSDHIGVVTSSNHSVPELVCAPFLPGRNLLYGVTSSGGGSLEWYARASGASIGELLEAAAQAPPGADSLLFLPYLEGERAPVWDPRASGAFVGIRTLHGRAHFARAVLEGVAFSLRQILDLVGHNSAPANGPILVSGGAARASLWNQIRADVFARPVAVPRCPHAGMLGAAMLAAIAAGRYDNCEAAASAMARIAERSEPDPDRSARYALLYSRYSELYPALRDLFARLHEGRNQSELVDA